MVQLVSISIYSDFMAKGESDGAEQEEGSVSVGFDEISVRTDARERQ